MPKETSSNWWID